MRWVTVGVGILLGCTALGADLEMKVKQTIEGYVPQTGTFPVTVEIKNTGPDTRGSIRVSSNSFTTEYPVELPQGSRKLVFTYPTSDWGEIRYVLQTTRGRLIDVLQPKSTWEQGRQVLTLISDSPGEMAFMRSKQQDSNNVLSVQDAYVKPGEAPDRPIGYAGIGAVVMGSGSERLEDHEVEALKLWVITGGTLIFVGGASAPILNDPRWRDALPAKDFKTVTVQDSIGLSSLGKHAAPECTLTTGTPLAVANPRMDGNVLISAERPFGIGRVIYASFNPFEAPLNKWDGRATAIKTLVRPAELQGRRAFVNQFSKDVVADPWASTTGGPPPPGSPAAAAKQADPFSTKLPPAEQMFFLLAAYFVCVVPLNFFVLKKLGKAEWAWFTAPLLSLVFAGVIFSQAQGLYSSQLSTASQGILVAQAGEPVGMFVGTSQVFIPRGGNYDLRLEGVDSVGVVEDVDMYGYSSYGRESNTLQLDPVDNGEIQVPHLRANNLAFREISYRQQVPVESWFTIRRAGGSSYEVRNSSPYTLTNGAICVEKQLYPIKKELAPGSRATISAVGEGLDVYSFSNPSVSLGGILTSRSLALVGRLKGFRPGPQLGHEVANKTDITLAFFAGGER